MPTEGLSEENRKLLDRVWGPALLVGFDATGPAILTPHGLNRLLDAARAEGPAPPADATTYSEPEVDEDDGVVTVRAFSTDKLRVVSFAVHPNHVLKVTTPGSAERLERPAPPGGGGATDHSSVGFCAEAQSPSPSDGPVLRDGGAEC